MSTSDFARVSVWLAAITPQPVHPPPWQSRYAKTKGSDIDMGPFTGKPRPNGAGYEYNVPLITTEQYKELRGGD